MASGGDFGYNLEGIPPLARDRRHREVHCRGRLAPALPPPPSFTAPSLVASSIRLISVFLTLVSDEWLLW
mgnify:CR=1 FL=1